jgi:hypothetical protein
MYFINKKVKYNMIMTKEELTRAKYITKSQKQKRRGSRDRPDKPTKHVKR